MAHWEKEEAGFEQILFEQRGEKRGEKDAVFTSAGVSSDRRFFVAGGKNGKLYFKDPDEGGKLKCWDLAVSRGDWDDSGDLMVVTFGQAPRIVFVATSAGCVFEVDLNSGEKLRSFKGHKLYAHISGLAVSGDGKTLISTGKWQCLCARCDKTIQLWDLTSSTSPPVPVKVIESEKYISSLACYGSKFCVGLRDGYLAVYDLMSHELLREFEGHPDPKPGPYSASPVNCLEFSQDGQWMFSGGNDMTIKIWDTSVEDCAQWFECKTLVGHSTLAGYSNSVMCVSESPCGRYLASGSRDGTIKVWEITTGAELRTIQAHKEDVCGISFKEGGRIVSASKEGKVKLLGLAPDLDTELNAVAVGADGSMIPMPTYYTTSAAIPQIEGPYTAEKNCTMLEHLVGGRVQRALQVLQSPGFPVDPNCVHHWRCTKTPFASQTHTNPSQAKSPPQALASLAISAQRMRVLSCLQCDAPLRSGQSSSPPPRASVKTL